MTATATMPVHTRVPSAHSVRLTPRSVISSVRGASLPLGTTTTDQLRPAIPSPPIVVCHTAGNAARAGRGTVATPRGHAMTTPRVRSCPGPGRLAQIVTGLSRSETRGMRHPATSPLGKSGSPRMTFQPVGSSGLCSRPIRCSWTAPGAPSCRHTSWARSGMKGARWTA